MKKKVNVFEIEYSEKQKEVDKILYDLSIQRYANRYDGTLVAALHDDECEELIRRFNEFNTYMAEMYKRSQERTEYDDNSEEFTLLIEVED